MLLPILFIIGIPYIANSELYFYISENYFFYLAGGLLVTISSFWWKGESNTITLSYTDFFVFAFTIYTISSRHIFFEDFNYSATAENVILLFLYATTRRLYTAKTPIHSFAAVLMSIGSIEIIASYLQLFGIIPNAFPLMPFGGSFANPAPFSLFICCTVPVVFHSLLHKNETNKLFKYSAATYLLLAVAIIIISQIRSAWLGLASGIIVILFNRYRILSFLNALKPSIKIAAAVAIPIFIISSGVLLFNLKRDSATGRVFIWENTIESIKKNPVFGTGTGSFAFSYNNAQSETVAEGNLSKREFLQADEIKMAYNDILQIIVELGFIGAILFLSIFICSVLPFSYRKYSSNSNYIPFVAIIVTVFISGLSSYPATVLKIRALLMIAFAVCAYHTKPAFTLQMNGQRHLTKVIPPALLASFILLSYKTIRQIYYLNTWKHTVSLVIEENDQEYEETIAETYSVLKHNPFFRYNYLSIMIAQGKSKVVRSEVKTLDNYFNGYNYLMMKGRYYLGQGNLIQAEKQFNDAVRLVPSRFTPRYNLLMCYDHLGKPEDAIHMANQILEMPIKMYDERVENIINTAKKYLGKMD